MFDTILVVDSDSARLCMAKNTIAERLKYNTVIESDEVASINMILAVGSTISLLLLDMGADKINALSMIREIKLKRPDFPIIILTEYGDHVMASEAIRMGANDFLAKPVTVERLGLSIASALRIYHLCKTVQKLEKKLESERASTSAKVSQPIASLAPFDRDGRIKKLRALEEDAIRFALNVNGGSMSKAARSLGIGRSTLYRKVSEIERHRKAGIIKKDYIDRENQITRPTMVMSSAEHSYAE